MGMAASPESSSPSLGDYMEDDEEDNALSYASMTLRLFNVQVLENTSFRYLTFDEWQTGEVTQDAYATVERPHWLAEFYAKCAQDEMRPAIQNPPLTHRTPMFIIAQRLAERKREKSYVCDNCQLPVPNSSVKRFFRNRYLSYINRYLSYISAKRKPTMLISFEWTK